MVRLLFLLGAKVFLSLKGYGACGCRTVGEVMGTEGGRRARRGESQPLLLLLLLCLLPQTDVNDLRWTKEAMIIVEQWTKEQVEVWDEGGGCALRGVC